MSISWGFSTLFVVKESWIMQFSFWQEWWWYPSNMTVVMMCEAYKALRVKIEKKKLSKTPPCSCKNTGCSPFWHLGSTEVLSCEILCDWSLARFLVHFFSYNYLHEVGIESVNINEKLKIHRLSDTIILPLII